MGAEYQPIYFVFERWFSKLIVLTAFEAVPGAGTEAGLAWNWGKAYVAAGHDVTVLTSAGADSVRHANHWREAGIDVVFLGGEGQARAPQTPRELFVVAHDFGKWSKACRNWLAGKAHVITAVHHVSWGSVRLKPPFLMDNEDLTTVWGPLGGGQLAQFSGLLPKNRLHEAIRAASFPVGWIMRRIDFIIYRRPTLALATNRATLRYINSIGVDRAEMMLADGVQPEMVTTEAFRQLNAQEVRLVWLGRMVASKRPDIAIDLIAMLKYKGICAKLSMLGDGPERAALQKHAADLGVAEHVHFVGRVPWERTFDYYDQSDFLVFTSMRDSSCPAVLEAAARGVPTLCLRHQGVEALVPETVAFGPSTFTSAHNLAADLAHIVEKFCGNEGAYKEASAAAVAFAHTQTWDDKVKKILTSLKIAAKK